MPFTETPDQNFRKTRQFVRKLALSRNGRGYTRFAVECLVITAWVSLRDESDTESAIDLHKSVHTGVYFHECASRYRAIL